MKNELIQKYPSFHFKDDHFAIGHYYWNSMRLSGTFFIDSGKFSADRNRVVLIKFEGHSGKYWDGKNWNFRYIDERSTRFTLVLYDLAHFKFYRSLKKLPARYIDKLTNDSILLYDPFIRAAPIEKYRFDDLEMVEIRMDRAISISTDSTIFRDTLISWFKEKGELLMAIRYPWTGGGYDLELHQNLHLLRKRIAGLEPSCSITIIKDFYLPIRGIVNDELVNRAQQYIDKNEEFVLLGLEYENSDKGIKPEFWRGENHEELIELLNESSGKKIAMEKDKDATWMKEHVEELNAYTPIENGDVFPLSY